jgi:general stress protein 26
MRKRKPHREQMEHLRKLIKGIRVAMLTTVSDHGLLHSRPLATQEVELDGDLWFFTKKDASKVLDLRKNSSVNVSYSDPENDRYVSVGGHAELIESKAKARKLWSPSQTVWFPDGPEDPYLMLLKVNVEQAQYWDHSAGKMVMFLALAKAYITGERPKESPHNVIHI